MTLSTLQLLGIILIVRITVRMIITYSNSNLFGALYLLESFKCMLIATYHQVNDLKLEDEPEAVSYKYHR